ncbi:MAG: radical SAM (seleno)protein TrsS [Ruminococcus sp.]|jgi:uncharacterized radical SAM superfamily Fe-S cluster-containing enzyme
MEKRGRICRRTQSVCPVCLKVIPAENVRYGTRVYMEKMCPEHGFFKTLIWNGPPDYESWQQDKREESPVNPEKEVKRGCPYDCGLCPNHRQKTCCVLLEVTGRCNLECPICFASSGKKAKKDPDLSVIERWYDMLMEKGGPFNIQLSGGEPSLRDDIPRMIRMGREKGFTFFQLNSNGIRIAEDRDYVRRLAEAGLNCVFLQFDGFKETTYRQLRGRMLLEEKKKAIAACGEAGIGVVLVPTLAYGVNTEEIGDILAFALDRMPVVRGVHFQPLSYFGRYEGMRQEKRYTLPDLLRDIERQTQGRMKVSDFRPGNAENPYCSFSGNFIRMEDKSLRPWNGGGSCGCGSKKQAGKGASAQARKFVARRWSAGRPAVKHLQPGNSCCCADSLDDFLERVNSQSLAVSCMTFMDAWNLDLDRLKECYIHEVEQKEGRSLIPFCAYNLTAEDGRTLYRGEKDESSAGSMDQKKARNRRSG